MCRHLVEIKNPYYNKTAYAQQYGELVTINRNLIPISEYIKVPCGKCAECKRRKINEYIQRAVIESMSSWVFFITLTYDNEHLSHNRINIDGEYYYFADYDDIQSMFKRFRDAGHIDREFRYIAVNEYGEKKHRPHFHLLLFVSRLENDDETTAENLREIIFNNLGTYFSKNIGTRKHPIYEKLYTYQHMIDYKGVHRTNYFVKWVEPNSIIDYLRYDNVQDTSIVKSIRYLCGYVSKPLKFEEDLIKKLDIYRESDPRKYSKLRDLLSSQVRFSKGFGCGFDNGKKFYLDKISVRCSSNTHMYGEIVNSLPDTYEEFEDLYPTFAEEIQEWRQRDFYQHFGSWKRCLNGMTADEYMYHCVYLKYFNDEFQCRYKRYKKDLKPTISTVFGVLSEYKYQPQTVKTSKPTDSKLYRYLRSMVDESIDKGLPCICFKIAGSFSYMPMCKYYKDRVCTFDDTYRLYEKLGVSNYSEWLSKFEDVINNRVAVEFAANVEKYENTDILDDEVHKMDSDRNIVDILFTNCK